MSARSNAEARRLRVRAGVEPSGDHLDVGEASPHPVEGRGHEDRTQAREDTEAYCAAVQVGPLHDARGPVDFVQRHRSVPQKCHARSGELNPCSPPLEEPSTDSAFQYSDLS